MFNRNAEIEIPCPNCGLKRKFKLKELEGVVKYSCDGCKKEINLDANKFARDLKVSEKKLENTLKKTIKNINLKLKM
jgi:DNA-directed RNA polymerase subunit RPC12/RpoP